jgi:hypothetical protein
MGDWKAVEVEEPNDSSRLIYFACQEFFCSLELENVKAGSMAGSGMREKDI